MPTIKISYEDIRTEAKELLKELKKTNPKTKLTQAQTLVANKYDCKNLAVLRDKTKKNNGYIEVEVDFNEYIQYLVKKYGRNEEIHFLDFPKTSTKDLENISNEDAKIILSNTNTSFLLNLDKENKVKWNSDKVTNKPHQLLNGGEGENKRKTFSQIRKGNEILKGTQAISDYFENKNIIEFDIGEHEYNPNTKTLNLKYFDKDIIEKTFNLPIVISIENFKEEDIEEYLNLFARLHKEHNPNNSSNLKHFKESINLFKNNVNSPFERIKKPVIKNPSFRELEHKTNKKY